MKTATAKRVVELALIALQKARSNVLEAVGEDKKIAKMLYPELFDSKMAFYMKGLSEVINKGDGIEPLDVVNAFSILLFHPTTALVLFQFAAIRENVDISELSAEAFVLVELEP